MECTGDTVVVIIDGNEGGRIDAVYEMYILKEEDEEEEMRLVTTAFWKTMWPRMRSYALPGLDVRTERGLQL